MFKPVKKTMRAIKQMNLRGTVTIVIYWIDLDPAITLTRQSNQVIITAMYRPQAYTVFYPYSN